MVHISGRISRAIAESVDGGLHIKYKNKEWHITFRSASHDLTVKHAELAPGLLAMSDRMTRAQIPGAQ